MESPRLNEIEKIANPNLLINGNFDFFQRVITSASTGVYMADRWINKNGVQFDKNGKGILVEANSTLNSIEQRIESIFTDLLAGEQVTLSLEMTLVSGAASAQPKVNIRLPVGVDDWSSDSIDSTLNLLGNTLDGTKRVYNVTFTVTALMAERGFSLEIGDLGSAINSIKYEKIQLRKGSIILPFTRSGKDYIEELKRCQRYFTKTYALQDPVGTITGNNLQVVLRGFVFGFAVSQARPFFFQSQMRQTPTLTLYNPFTGAVATAYRRTDNGNDSAPVISQRTLSDTVYADILDNGTNAVNYISHAIFDAEL